MNIIGIMGLSFLIAMVASLLVCLFANGYDSYELYTVAVVVLIVVTIAGTFIGIGINTANERVYIASYEAQKILIEDSINNENLTGFERAELVKKASELNGELAERKTRFNCWYYVCYNNTLYDNVDFIRLEKTK